MQRERRSAASAWLPLSAFRVASVPLRATVLAVPPTLNLSEVEPRTVSGPATGVNLRPELLRGPRFA